MSAEEPNFDRVARMYRWAEYLALGPILQKTRVHFIPELSHCRSALVLGDGDGRFLQALLAANTNMHAFAVDTSERMLSLLRKRCAFAADRVETRRKSALLVEPPDGTDLVVTHFFLDCLEQRDVESLSRCVAGNCSPGTVWLVSDFQVPDTHWLRRLAKAYIWLLYLAFGLLTSLRVRRLPDIAYALRQAGFTRIAWHERLAGMVYTELWELKHHDKISSESGEESSMRDAIHDTAGASKKMLNPSQPLAVDPVPDPEPAVPSLAGPDAGVFQHELVANPTNATAEDPKAE